MSNNTCSKCFYSLTIAKDTDFNKQQNITNKKSIPINTPEQFIAVLKKIKKDGIDDDIDINLNFTEEDMKTYLNGIKSLTEEDKQTLIIKYKQFKNKKITSEYIKKCINCESKYQLEPNSIIYSVNFGASTIFDDNNIDLKILDPTLPRTKDYICVNEECPTNVSKSKEILSLKEAIFYRSNNTYNLKYACCVCKTKWNI